MPRVAKAVLSRLTAMTLAKGQTDQTIQSYFITSHQLYYFLSLILYVALAFLEKPLLLFKFDFVCCYVVLIELASSLCLEELMLTADF